MYKATVQKHLFLFLLGMNLFLVPLRWGDPFFLVITMLVAFTCMLMCFLKYELEIQEQTLLYRIRLFKFTIYEKEADVHLIKMLHFKRVSSHTRIAIVKLYKGWNLRISLFSPVNVFEELERFAERNNIAINKTKDYLVLEKMA